MDELIAAHRPDLIVIACNTASTIVLPDLRKRISLPFVGTVPAIKPACANSVSRHIAVLGTEATIAREYTRALIRDYAGDCRVTLVGSKRSPGTPRPSSPAHLSPTKRFTPKSRHAFATTARGQIRSYSPAPIIHC